LGLGREQRLADAENGERIGQADKEREQQRHDERWTDRGRKIGTHMLYS